MSKTFRFKTPRVCDDGRVELGRYRDGSIAMQLTNVYGEPIVVPTVNLKDYDETPQPGHVFIKDYGDTDGIYDCLHDNGIVGDKIRTVEFGGHDAKAYECALLITEEDAYLR